MKERFFGYCKNIDVKKNDSEFHIELDICANSETKIDISEKNKYYKDLDIYLKSIKNYDVYSNIQIIEIINKIYEVLSLLNIYKIEISIKFHGNSINTTEFVTFSDGNLDSYSFSKGYWNDIIFISENHKGTKISYQKDGKYVKKIKDIEPIYKEICAAFKTLIDLKELSKKEKNKSKVLTKRKK